MSKTRVNLRMDPALLDRAAVAVGGKIPPRSLTALIERALEKYLDAVVGAGKDGPWILDDIRKTPDA